MKKEKINLKLTKKSIVFVPFLLLSLTGLASCGGSDKSYGNTDFSFSKFNTQINSDLQNNKLDLSLLSKYTYPSLHPWTSIFGYFNSNFIQDFIDNQGVINENHKVILINIFDFDDSKVQSTGTVTAYLLIRDISTNGEVTNKSTFHKYYFDSLVSCVKATFNVKDNILNPKPISADTDDWGKQFEADENNGKGLKISVTINDRRFRVLSFEYSNDKQTDSYSILSWIKAVNGDLLNSDLSGKKNIAVHPFWYEKDSASWPLFYNGIVNFIGTIYDVGDKFNIQQGVDWEHPHFIGNFTWEFTSPGWNVSKHKTGVDPFNESSLSPMNNKRLFYVNGDHGDYDPQKDTPYLKINLSFDNNHYNVSEGSVNFNPNVIFNNWPSL